MLFAWNSSSSIRMPARSSTPLHLPCLAHLGPSFRSRLFDVWSLLVLGAESRPWLSFLWAAPPSPDWIRGWVQPGHSLREAAVKSSLCCDAGCCFLQRFIYLLLFERQERERKGDGERESESALLSACSFPKWLQQLGLGPAEGRSQELYLSLPCG